MATSCSNRPRAASVTACWPCDVEGREVAYERTGHGPPLVLVHGAVEDHRTWRFQVPDLAGVATVVAWDEPGCGALGRPAADVGLPGLANGLAAVVETVGPAHVLGFSWGGTVVLELWRHRPDLVGHWCSPTRTPDGADR